MPKKKTEIDPSSHTPDPSVAFAWHKIEQWGPVECGCLVATDGGEFKEPLEIFFRFNLDPPDLWPGGAIMKNWGWHLPHRFWRTRQVKGDDGRRPAPTDELRKWIKATRRLADDADFVFGGDAPALMRHAATELEETLSWAALRFKKAPRNAGRLVELLWVADLWAFDQVRKTLEELMRPRGAKDGTRQHVVTEILAPVIRAAEDAGLGKTESDAWKMAINRLDKRILDGERENLMADIISAMRRGPYDRDGSERNLP